MAAEELDFKSSVEALFVEALREEMTPQLRNRLRDAGIDLDHLLPAYPRTVFSRGCRIVVEELSPAVPPEEALRLLGRRLIDGYRVSLLGKAVIGVFKLAGVRRSMDRLTRAFRHGDNYTDTKLTSVAPGVGEVWINQVNGQPTFTQGILEASMDWVGARNGRVEIARLDGDGCVYRLTWDERA